MKKYMVIIMLCLGLAACQKEQVPFYSGPEGISFYRLQNSADSMIYTFAYKPLGTEVDTVFLDMRVLGTAKDHARKIKVVAGSGTSARAGVDYKLPEVTLPAGELTVRYPVVLFNTPEMQNNSYLLVVELGNTEDLIVGALGLETGGTVASKNMKIWISNKVEKPSYWSSIQGQFGSYSEVKFRFMIGALGISDFSRESIGNAGYYAYPGNLRNALIEYEAKNGPLIDENGNRVTFP